MDIVELVNNLRGNFHLLNTEEWITKLIDTFSLRQSIFVLLFAIIAATITAVLIWHRKWKLREEREPATSSVPRPRFRKRDKVLFYGRKMLRKVRSISGEVPGTQGRKRRIVMKFARKLLQLKKDSTPVQLKVLEPPAEFLEEDLTNDERVPPDALYMLQSIRVFGHFEKPVFLKLCKHTEILNLPAGSYLFKIGDADENVYVIQNGKVNVFITGPDGSSICLKVVKTGESVTSLLSFTDVLTGHPNPYKTVSARAVVDSTVVRLPMQAFQDVFEEYPDIFIRVMQVIMVRLQRVTFTTLHQYLGLSAELVNPGTHRRKMSPVITKNRDFDNNQDNQQFEQNSEHFLHTHPVNIPPNGSGGHRRTQSNVDTYYSTSSSAGTHQGTPDMVPEFEQRSSFSGTIPDIHPGHTRKRMSEQMDEETLVEIATEAFIRELRLDDPSIIRGKVEIREVAAGTQLMKEESNKDIALIYLISGSLIVSQRTTDGDEVHMYSSYPGEIVGGLAVLTGEPSFFTIKAKSFSRIALLSKNTFYGLMREQPKIVLHIAHTVVKRLSPFVRQVDFALDWVFLESGRAVYRQDDESDSTFIVLSGRLRSVITHSNGKKELVGEYGKGDLIGIVEMVTQTKRSTTVMAVRDSELAKLPEGLFNAIKLRFPIVVTRLINLLGHRILGSWQKPSITTMRRSSAAVDSRPMQLNFSTVAIVAISDDVPLTAFTYELYHSLCSIGPTLRLTSDVIKKVLGSSILDPNNEYRLTSWLAQQEDQHKISLYQCDLTFSAWTQRCIRQADCILIVGLGDKTPILGKIEKEVERLSIRTQKELVLLHKETGEKPSNTVAWLNMRSWVSSHHHIQCPKRMFTRRSQCRINELYSKVLMSEPNIHSDFSRLARWLTGTSVGLVLGGGGARGAAHVGMIKAIQEAGIPIDMVAGVSIGAFMGALWCSEKNITTMTQKAREWSKKMTQWWRQILDLTYPMTSMFSGRDFNQTIRGTFGDTHIEDLWLPFFTVTTDITASCMRIHTHGSLWRYVRASMSLSGYMPPLCDPSDGHLLLDGGYVNNLPADVMRSYGACHILAIDVGSVDDTDLTNYGDDLSGWWLLWKRWNPFTSNVKVPNLPDIQSRLAYVSCVRQLEEVKQSDYCDYIRPPIDKYRTLQFGSFDEIKDVGYQHGKTYFDGQLRAGALPLFKANQASQATTSQQHLSGYTFTDLAQMVCKVPRNSYVDQISSSEEEDELEEQQEVGYASEPSAGILDEEDKLRKKQILLESRSVSIDFSDEALHELLREIQKLSGVRLHSSGNGQSASDPTTKTGKIRRRAGSLSLSENELESDNEFVQ
ncbi:neuropathy target esterase sws isoform X1 [Chrysoperla carnea]|uniref:neuropathy target esterase sws isoform X1 n=1 Tax=Chrysoperla carnea TaxID=189513 RepID=UPI001D073E8A|nr:neuropathy target esterase sws isoform X1 [Chrysoperla carnea]